MKPDETPRSTIPAMQTRNAVLPAVSGFVASVPMNLIWRALHLQYRHETAMATFFIVSTLVSGYLTGKLIKSPLSVVALAVFFAAVSVAILHS
jgi:hypothetical protein